MVHPPEPLSDVFDAATIADIATLGSGANILARVVDLFQRETPRAIDKLNDALAAQSWIEAADAAHALKSVCGSIGAGRAYAACNQLEVACREENATAAAIAFEEVRLETDVALAAAPGLLQG